MAAIPRIALIGAGSMGSNHARVLAETDDAELAIVIDNDVERARQLADPSTTGGFATDIGVYTRATPQSSPHRLRSIFPTRGS